MQFIGSGDVIAIGQGWEIFSDDIYVTTPGTLTLQGIPTSIVVSDIIDAEGYVSSLTYKKRLHYIVDELIPSYLFSDHPEWLHLMEIFLEYLDVRVYQEVLNIQNSININNKDISDELIMELYKQYGAGLVNEDFLEINNDDRKNFAQLGKFINNLKGTKLSLQYLFLYLAQSQIVGLVEKKVFEYLLEEVRENKDLLQIDPNPNPKFFVDPFTYNIVVNEIFNDLPEILKTVHPTGFKYVILFEDLILYGESFNIDPDHGKIRVSYVHRYDGLYNRMGYFNGPDHSYSVQIKPILYQKGFDK